ncbi:MAG: hypothetical protein MUO50_03965, partial [Longimicrobiales bacterium]|nr:hypothetical protein [Longimicrobiales bacterium]
QEDACQALAVSPWTKYENERGPGAPELVGAIPNAANAVAARLRDEGLAEARVSMTFKIVASSGLPSLDKDSVHQSNPQVALAARVS